MGGLARYATVSLGLPTEIEVGCEQRLDIDDARSHARFVPIGGRAERGRAQEPPEHRLQRFLMLARRGDQAGARELRRRDGTFRPNRELR